MPLAESSLARTAIAAAIVRATNEAHRSVVKLDAQSLKDLQEIYRRAADEISQAIAANAGMDNNLALAELQSTLAQVNAILQSLQQQRDVLLQGSLQQAATLGVQPYAGAIEAAAAMRVSQEALQFVRTFVAADGLQLSDRIWRLDRGARDAVTNAIEQAVIQGHGAAQAATQFLMRGEPVPVDLRNKVNAANAPALSRRVSAQLLTGEGNAMDNALRLFRTEINRAHGEAYMMGAENLVGFVGFRFLLSPAHPKHDICDLLAEQNLYGLGPGVYPSREKCPWPAHPNTLSFLVSVFEHEVTQADREGKETPLQALARLNPEQQQGVLGAGKFELYREGKISQGMIRTPLSKVKQRLTRLEGARAAKRPPQDEEVK